MDKGKTEDFYTELSQKMCNRLKECREHRGYTRQSFADEVGYTYRAYTDIENGRTKLTDEKVLIFATALNVNPKYISCETDVALPVSNTQGTNTPATCDNLLLKHFESLGHTLLFHVVKLRSDKKPRTINILGKDIIDWESIKEPVTLDKLKDFDLCDPHCVLEDCNGKSEVIVSDVTVNGTRISFGAFTFLANRIDDYIDFTLSNLRQFKTDTLTQSGTNATIDREIRNRPASLSELADEEIIKDVLSHAVEVEHKTEDGAIFKAMRIEKKYLSSLGMTRDFYFTMDEEHIADVLKNFLRDKRNKK